MVVRRQANRVELDVIDDGEGVPTHLRQQLFEPFFTTYSGGTGLGLYIAREMCAANAAILEYVASPAETGGADFRDSVRGPASMKRAERRSDQATATVLVVDDEADIRELLELTLLRMGLAVASAASVAEASALLKAQRFDLCLTDMRLPDGDGLELVRHIGEHCSDLPVAVITAYGSAENAVAALKAGAFDYLSKPVSLEQLRTLVKSALKLPQPPTAAQPAHRQQLLGDSPAMQQARDMIDKLARSQAPVYISGESGSGKELAARLIHEQGARRDQPFVPVNCGAIPENLMESEFFGYKKGAFTGAEADRDGFFQAANGGTLFLDEVADLPLAMQVKLLRAIQEKRVRKVGCDQARMRWTCASSAPPTRTWPRWSRQESFARTCTTAST